MIAKGVQKRAFVAALRPTARDVDHLGKVIQPPPPDLGAALDLFESVAREASAAGAKQSSARAASAGVQAIIEVARQLVKLRADALAGLRAAHQRIWDAYRGRIGLTAATFATPTGPAWQPVMDRERSLPHVEIILARSASEAARATGARDDVAPGERRTREVVAVLTSAASTMTVSRDDAHVSLAVLLDWAEANAVEGGAVRATCDFLASLKVRPQDITVKGFGQLGDEYIGDQQELGRCPVPC